MEKEISILINSKINEINAKYPNFVSEETKNYAIINYINSGKSIEDIDKEVTAILANMTQDHEEKLSVINSVESFNPDVIDTNLNVNKQGVYLSTPMVTALSLINCNNIKEINEWINNVPNLYMVAPKEERVYSPEELEIIKKELFDLYEDTKISTEANIEINNENKEEAMRYALHKKLSGLNLSIEDELRLGDIGFSQGIPALYSEVKRICVDRYGEEQGSNISNKIVYYFTTDSENFTSSTYEEMKAFNEAIKSSIQQCNLSGGDYQLVISSLNYGNTVNAIGYGNFEYTFKSSEMGKELAEKLGSSYRLRSLINRNAADDMISKKFTKDNKEIVTQILRESLTQSLQNFNNNLEKDGKNRSYELFNELVEIQKPNRDYKLVWEDRFGITLEDMVRQVIVPNKGLIDVLKSKGVDFMYNETLLQESKEKRDKVMKTMEELQKLAPGLINVFGDQEHTFSSDYSKDGIEQLKEVAEFDKKMANKVFNQEPSKDIISFTNGPTKVKLECSEQDLYLSQGETNKMQQSGMSKKDILKYKQGLENIHKEIFSQVPFERKCEWTVLNNISGEYYDQNYNTNQEAYIGKYTKISDMARKDNSQKVNKDRADFYNWKNAAYQVQQQDTQQAVMNKPNVRIRTPQPNNTPAESNGFASVITLSLIVGFACGVVSVVTYLLLKG